MTKLENIAINATHWIGSTSSLILHTILFTISFVFYFCGIAMDRVLLVLTTIVSLEAIYLSIFIQMSVNLQAKQLLEVHDKVEDMQDDIDDISEVVDDLQEDTEQLPLLTQQS